MLRCCCLYMAAIRIYSEAAHDIFPSCIPAVFFLANEPARSWIWLLLSAYLFGTLRKGHTREIPECFGFCRVHLYIDPSLYEIDQSIGKSEPAIDNWAHLNAVSRIVFQRVYFDLTNGNTTHRDEAGVLVDDVAEAIEEALEALRELRASGDIDE